VGQEHDADAIVTGGGKRDADRGARASTRNRCGICIKMPAPSPVFFSQPQAPRCLKVEEDLERVLDDARGLAPLQIDNEADAARVVLMSRIVEALRGGRSCQFHG
jgi:hypothetical protein